MCSAVQCSAVQCSAVQSRPRVGSAAESFPGLSSLAPFAAPVISPAAGNMEMSQAKASSPYCGLKSVFDFSKNCKLVAWLCLSLGTALLRLRFEIPSR